MVEESLKRKRFERSCGFRPDFEAFGYPQLASTAYRRISLEKFEPVIYICVYICKGVMGYLKQPFLKDVS